MMSARGLLLGVVSGAAVVTVAGPSVADAASMSRPSRPAVWTTVSPGWKHAGTVVSGGRVWVLDQRGTSTGFRVRSRGLSLKAKTERSWRAEIPESLQGVPGFSGGNGVYRRTTDNAYLIATFAGLAVEGSTVYVGAAWCLENSGPGDVSNPDRCAGLEIVAVPRSGGTGTVVSQPGERLAGSSPATGFRATDGGGAQLRTLATGETFAVPGLSNPEPDPRTFEIDGPRILQYRYRPDDASHDFPVGWTLFDYRTGAAQYAVDYATLFRTITRRSAGRLLLPSLRRDGELAVRVQSNDRNRRHGIRPAFVDKTGAHRFVGRRLPGAYGATVTPAGPHRRNVVSITGYTKRTSKRRSCDGTWITDRAGRRGVRVQPPSTLEFTEDGSPYWDGKTLLLDWVTSRKTGLPGGRIVSWRGLDRVALRKATVPTCPRGH